MRNKTRNRKTSGGQLPSPKEEGVLHGKGASRHSELLKGMRPWNPHPQHHLWEEGSALVSGLLASVGSSQSLDMLLSCSEGPAQRTCMGPNFTVALNSQGNELIAGSMSNRESRAAVKPKATWEFKKGEGRTWLGGTEMRAGVCEAREESVAQRTQTLAPGSSFLLLRALGGSRLGSMSCMSCVSCMWETQQELLGSWLWLEGHCGLLFRVVSQIN